MNDGFLYHYKGRVVDVYDGDTVTLDIDLGFGVWLYKQKVRLAGINAPEVRGPEREAGIRSRDYLRILFGRYEDDDIVISTYRDRKGKYGRWIASIYVQSKSVAEMLVDAGHAVYREY